MASHRSRRWLILVVGIAVLANMLLAVAPAEAVPSGYTVNGLDVYNGNGAIDWTAASNAGARFGWAKATEGLTYVDPRYATNHAEALAAGVKLGAYAFGRPDKGNPKAQADLLVDKAQYVADGRNLPPQLDIEWPYWANNPGACYGLSTTEMVAWIRAFVDQVKARTGRDAAIYTAFGWWDQCTGSNSSFSANPLEIARYGATTPGRMPASWSRPTAWQYDCSHTFPGAPSQNNVCQTAFNGSLSDLEAFASGGSPSDVVQMDDFTGDHRADLGAQYRSSGDIRMWASTGDFSADGRLFAGPTALVGQGWGGANVERIVTGDFNGDGRSDIAAQYRSGDVRAWCSLGDLGGDGRLFHCGGALVGQGWGGANVERILTGDFNGDRRTDIGAQYRSGDIRVWASTGDFSADGRLFAGPTALVGQGWGGANAERILTGDFNGDGKTDIAAQDRSSGDVRAWYSTGDLSGDGRLFAGGVLVGQGWGSANVERILTADFTGDGKVDIGAQYRSGDIRVWASTGDFSGAGRLFAGRTALVGQGWGGANVERILVGDFNGDFRWDIAAQYRSSGDIRAWCSFGNLTSDGQLFACGGPRVGQGWGGANVERIL